VYNEKIDPVKIGEKYVGAPNPAYIIAEIGINHNGDINLCKNLIDVAINAKCDAVKFQKRQPEICVPINQQSKIRETPWGMISYLEYRKKTEFGQAEFEQIDFYCRTKKIDWFASCWDEPSVDFISQFDSAAVKVASAKLTDDKLLKKINSQNKPVILSTGMSTISEIDHAVDILNGCSLLIAHSTSSYPCSADELNLQMISTLKKRYGVPIGYSGHETGLQTTIAAAAMGAEFIERHITLDRTMWGSDQAASVEPHGLKTLVRDIRVVELARGNGVKEVYQSELAALEKLRGS